MTLERKGKDPDALLPVGSKELVSKKVCGSDSDTFLMLRNDRRQSRRGSRPEVVVATRARLMRRWFGDGCQGQQQHNLWPCKCPGV